MKRRDFFKKRALGLSIPTLSLTNKIIKRNKNNPTIITTWNLPEANKEGLKILNRGHQWMLLRQVVELLKLIKI